MPETGRQAPSAAAEPRPPAIVFPLLRRDEGLRLSPYQDHLGYWTVGYGHLVDRRRGGSLPAWVQPSFPITPQEAEDLLLRDAHIKYTELEDGLQGTAVLPGLSGLRRAILLSMAFQLGIRGLLGFRRMLDAVVRRDWSTAADEMRDSAWWQDLGTHTRAERLARAMDTGDPTFLDLPRETDVGSL